MFDDTTTLIPGGTGSFGKKYDQTPLGRSKPKKIAIVPRDEMKQLELGRVCDQPCVRDLLGDVRDAERPEQAMRGVDHVIHAAALKQAPAGGRAQSKTHPAFRRRAT